jgi:hypothetical protein
MAGRLLCPGGAVTVSRRSRAPAVDGAWLVQATEVPEDRDEHLLRRVPAVLQRDRAAHPAHIRRVDQLRHGSGRRAAPQGPGQSRSLAVINAYCGAPLISPPEQPASAVTVPGQGPSPPLPAMAMVMAHERSPAEGFTRFSGRRITREYGTLVALDALTGPVLRHMSFKVAGEPIVETPEDAIRAPTSMRLDYRAVGAACM